MPFTLKQVPAAQNASVGEAADLRARSGVPHVAIYRRCCEDFELPPCAVNGDWFNCTDAIAEQEAHAHWLRHLQAFPREVVGNKQWVWVETINEPWKGSSTRNNAEWLAKFSYYTALEAMAAGYTWGSFGGDWADFDVTGTEAARRIVQHFPQPLAGGAVPPGALLRTAPPVPAAGCVAPRAVSRGLVAA